MPGAPPRACTTSPESSASAGRPDAPAAARAFSSALPMNVAAVSSGSGRLSAAAEITSTPKGDSNSAISRTLPGLWLAITRRGAVNRLFVIDNPSRRRWADAPGSNAERPSLRRHQLRHAAFGQRHHGVEGLGAEGLALGRALHLDNAAAARQHEIGIGLGGAVLGIVEVEHGRAVDQAAG